MPSAFLLDTCILIYDGSGRYPGLTERLQSVVQSRLRLSLVTVGELLFGAAGARNAQAEYAKVERLMKRFRPLPLDLETARHYAYVRHHTRRQPIGSNDAWIAAQGLRYGLTVVTANVREFARVPGLQVEDWTA